VEEVGAAQFTGSHAPSAVNAPGDSPKPEVTPDNFRRLRVGMRQREVEAVLGGPGHFGGHVTMSYFMSWTGDNARVLLQFDEWGVEEVGRGWFKVGDKTVLRLRPDLLEIIRALRNAQTPRPLKEQ
jgi:hypothetical protein